MKPKPAYVPGSVLDGRYELLGVIGSGGGGTVYEAENVRTRHKVAIKVIHAHLGKHEDMRERFHKEARAAAAIGSEHVVRVYDLGELPGGIVYLVMEHLSGEDLLTWSSRLAPVPPAQLAPIALQVLDALVATHGAGIIHRDLKPENVFLTRSRDGVRVKILDFGVSKFIRSAEPSFTETSPGIIVGSPSYMSPEQARGQTDVDSRSDLYSLGAIMFECLTGRLPFEAPNFNDLLFQVVLEDAPHPLELQPDLDPMFAAIVSRAMRRDRDARFQSAQEFREAIRTWQEKTKGVDPSSAGLRVVSQVVPAARREPVRRENARPPTPAVATPSKPGRARKGMMLLATLAVLGIGGAASWRALVKPTAARAPVAPASVAAPTPAPMPTPVVAPHAAPDPSTAVIASPPDPPAPRPSRAAPPTTWVPRPRAVGAKAIASSPSAAVAPTSSAAPPAPAPPADTTANTTVTKRPETVEGRTIRTDL